MSPHRRPTTLPSLIALTATLVAVSLGLAACGGSSSTTTTTQTTANAAATGTTTAGASTSGTTSTGTTSTGTPSSGTTSNGKTTPGSPLTGTTPAARAARLAAVRTCLSKKGITLPQHGAGGVGGAQLPKGMSRAQFVEALQSCGTGFNSGHLGKRGKGIHNPFNNPRFHAALVRFSACMRQNGIDIGEPNTSGKGRIFNTSGINTGSAQFKTAEVKCRSTLLYALKPVHKANPGAGGSTTTG